MNAAEDRLTRHTVAYSALAVLLVSATACSDNTGPANLGDTSLAGMIVSQPVTEPGGASASVAALRSSPLVGGSVVYVSLVPGTVPAGLQAAIRDQENGQVVTTAVVDGGFDPVPIAANVGDALLVEITRSGAAGVLRALSLVRPSHPPVVVRTSPPRGGRDVPLNASMVIVFSEPLDSATADAGSVEVWRGATPVAGTVRFADAAHLRAEFHPDSLLAPQTDYQLVITTAIRDVNGLALDSAVTVPFTTGTTAPATNLVFASVSVGYMHACGVTTAGAAYCWGSNISSELGDGTLSDGSTTPVPVAGGLTFATVSAGFWRTCGVTTSGAAYCWGAGGLLGDSLGSVGFTPLPVAGGLTFASVSAGMGHTCGVTTVGAAYCWGGGSYGELGDGTTNSRGTPVPVAGGLTFRAVSAGTFSTCGVTTTGAAYCWGVNTLGELGTGTPTGPEQCHDPGFPDFACSTIPAPVAGGFTFGQVDAQAHLACGVTTGGSAYCWGDNAFDRLGIGTSTGPEQCEGEDGRWSDTGDPYPIPCSRVPVVVPGLFNMASVSAGEWSACGLNSTGVAVCWGGDKGTSDTTTTPVAVLGGLTFATLSEGSYSTCGVTTAGVAYCWGANLHGELGDGTTTSSSVPVKVAGQR
jgi:alpha-tubulin suppressor-like RCC1 family protein